MSDEETTLLDFITKIATDNQRKAARPSALAALTRLIAAKEQAEKERDEAIFTLHATEESCTVLTSANATLTARLRSMCEAMEPFVAACEEEFTSPATDMDGDDEAVGAGEDGDMTIKFGHIRRARAELDAAKKELKK